MKKMSKLIAFAAVLMLAGFMGSAHAQRLDRLSERDMKNLLERIETSADRFRGSLENGLDRSRLDDSRTEDNINQYIKDFEQATDRLKSGFDDDRSASGLVEEVLRRAANIDNFMTRYQVSGRAEEDWRQLRGHLDTLANAYNVTWTWAGISDTPRRVNDKSVKKVLDRLESDSERFRKSLDDSLDRSRLDDTRAEDEINEYVKEFEKAADRLEDRFNSKQTASSEAEEVLRRAALIDTFVRNHRMTDRAVRDWMSLRRSLDDLALAYTVTWSW
jgi:cytochrome c556